MSVLLSGTLLKFTIYVSVNLSLIGLCSVGHTIYGLASMFIVVGFIQVVCDYTILSDCKKLIAVTTVLHGQVTILGLITWASIGIIGVVFTNLS